MKRTKASVRFDPYYKVQWYDEIICAWRDIQRQFSTPEEAIQHFLPGERCRLMEVTIRGRHPLPEVAAR